VFSTRDAYGLKALVELARQPAGEALQSREIAARQGIPQAYLDQLLVSLRRAGLVKSVRGAGGGYLPAFDPAALTVAEALKPLGNELFDDRWRAEAGEDSSVTAIFDDALGAARKVLQGVRVSDLVDAEDAQRSAQSFMMHI
jgi:Rrf2 family protein